MRIVLIALLLTSCENQYLVIPRAQVLDGTPQYYYDDVWVGTNVPTYTVPEGSLDLTADEHVTVDFTFSGEFEFTVTEFVFFGLETGNTEFLDHWLVPLEEEEIADGLVEIEFELVDETPSEERCTGNNVGGKWCWQEANEGVTALGVSPAGDDAVGMYLELPILVEALEAPVESDTCAAYTYDDCCAGSPGIAVVECAWDPECACPGGTGDLGVREDGWRWCDCPG